MKTSDFLKVVLALVISAFLVSAGYAQPYTEVYVFGNSHVDVGNFYILTGGSLPPSPPYLDGRHSNGPVYPEVLADNLGLGPLGASLTGGTNHAWAAARSLEDAFGLIPSIRHQVEGYVDEVDGEADPEALYVLEGGGNDVSYALEEDSWAAALAAVKKAAQGMVGSLEMLADAGAVHFIVPNLENVSESAWYCGNADADALVAHFNSVLKAGIAGLNGDLRIVYFDLATFAKNASAHFTTDCLGCVPFLEPGPVCPNPDELYYWDDGHFSAPVHQLIGDAITVAILQDEVRHLRKAGVLSKGNSNALLVKLDRAYGKLEDRKPKTAANEIRAFANQVNAFVRTGKLSAEQAELLLVGAYGIIEQP